MGTPYTVRSICELLLNASANDADGMVEVLEKKCAFFWRLDDIWSTRPNLTPIAPVETSSSQANTSIAQNSPDHLELGADEWPDSDVDLGETREGEDISEQSTNNTMTCRSQTPRSRLSAPRRGGKDSAFREFFESNQKHRYERSENRTKMEAETHIEIARIQAESSQRLLSQQMQFDREREERQAEREERQAERDRENAERQMTMLRMILDSLKDRPSTS